MGKLHPTKIQWCTHTVNPVVAVDRATGTQGWACTKVATGCMHCYAEALNLARFGTGHPFDVASESLVEWRLDDAALDSVLRRRKPATIFWCDMTDLFHERVPDAWLDRIFATAAMTPGLNHLFLTKRAARQREYFSAPEVWARIEVQARKIHLQRCDRCREADAMFRPRPHFNTGSALIGPFENMAFGTSVSNQDDADRNIPELENTPAVWRFVSYEPATENVLWDDGEESWLTCAGNEDEEEACGSRQNGMAHFQGIDVIIVGGESGPKARPFDLAYARSTIAQCEEAGVVTMVKQLGANVRDMHATCADNHDPDECWPEGTRAEGQNIRLRDSHGGDPSEWPEDLRPYAATPERWPWAEVAQP